MQAIYKYEVSERVPVSIIEAPITRPLKVDYQNGHPFLWAMVDSTKPPVRVKIFRVPTGHPFDGDVVMSTYMNTTVAQSEPFVWHWFYQFID